MRGLGYSDLYGYGIIDGKRSACGMTFRSVLKSFYGSDFDWAFSLREEDRSILIAPKEIMSWNE